MKSDSVDIQVNLLARMFSKPQSLPTARRKYPHELTEPGQYCLFETTIDGHPGNLWLYIWLPDQAQPFAVRVIRKGIALTFGTMYRILTWNEDALFPTVEEPLQDGWFLVNGRLLHS